MAETARAAIARAAALFRDFSETPMLDAELLMAQAMGCARETLLLRRLDDAVPDAFDGLVARRCTHEPIAYIGGSRAFWTIELGVGPGALIPRADSETLIEAAVDHFGDAGPGTILDLGTGPGTLLLAALAQWPGANGLGIDRSAAALALAGANAERLGMADRARFVRGDWAAAVAAGFDLILANPPYIAAGEAVPDEVRCFEPAEALFAGGDGLAAYRAIIPGLGALLNRDGAAILEIGATQAGMVGAMVDAAGLAGSVRDDLGGRARALVVRHPPA